MTEYQIIKSSDIEKLNNYVYNNLNASIFQTGHMVEVYQRTANCEPLLLTAVDNSDNIIGSLVAINFSEKAGILKSFSAHTTIRGGPIIEDSQEGLDICNNLLNTYEKLKMSTIYTRIYPLKYSDIVRSALESNQFVYEGYLNFLINLDRNQDQIWSDINKGRRKNIHKAIDRFNLIANEISERENIPLFYEILEETHHHAAIHIPDISLFYAVFDLLVPRKLAKFIFVKMGGKTIGCRLVLTYKNEIYDWYAGARRDSLDYYPNDFLVWHILKWGSENGYKQFDFGGAGKPDEEYPVRTFKERFGGKLINFGSYTKIYNPLKYQLAIKGYGILRTLKKSKNK